MIRIKHNQALVLALLIFGLSHIFGAESQAQERRPAAQDSVKATEELDLQKQEESVKIFLDKIDILGRIEKPQTVFIIPGKDPAVDDIHIDRSFFKEIFRSVEKDDITRRNAKRQE